jgi:hypothetical protein
MSRRRTSIIATIVCVVLLGIAIFKVARNVAPGSKSLGEDPLAEVSPVGLSDSARQHYLEGDFKIVTDIRGLPGAVVQAFTERGGSRLLIANPGERFEAGDDILDASLPRKRLIFAGVVDGRCFVHFAQGGWGLGYIVEFFGQTPTESMKPLWRGYCKAPAKNIQELRHCVANPAIPEN